ncbi:MAG: DUF4837 family protein [Rikenellaceae bacterium]|nr:DUF4837 family protein [Rikenellaceae bacterium]
MRLLTLSALSIAAVLLWSCGGEDRLPESHGRAYELMVVCPENEWNAALGDTLREILMEPFPMLNQREPWFDVVYIRPSGYKNLLLRGRNLLEVKIDSKYKEAAMTARYDVRAAPQLIVSLTGPGDSAVTAYVSENRKALRQIYDMAERDWFKAVSARYNEKKLGETIQNKFGFRINIPKGYTQKYDGDDMMWLSYELPLGSVNLLIYTNPYSGKDDFTLDSLRSRRNRFAARIPGPSRGSYLTTSPVFDPEVQYVQINGRSWAEMRGFWDVEGDFMGGPFVSYSTMVDGRVITIDGFVFNPKLDGRLGKRNYIRQIENIMYSVEFVGQPDQAE